MTSAIAQLLYLFNHAYFYYYLKYWWDVDSKLFLATYTIRECNSRILVLELSIVNHNSLLYFKTRCYDLIYWYYAWVGFYMQMFLSYVIIAIIYLHLHWSLTFKFQCHSTCMHPSNSCFLTLGVTFAFFLEIGVYYPFQICNPSKTFLNRIHMLIELICYYCNILMFALWFLNWWTVTSFKCRR